MRRQSYWTRSVSLLGGTAKFDVHAPDEIEMAARGILVRQRKANVTARLEIANRTWQVCLGPFDFKLPCEGKKLVTMRDLNRVRRVIMDTWAAMWTPTVQEQVFPEWFMKQWEELTAKISTTFGEQRSAHLQQRQRLFKRLAEWQRA